MNLPPMIFCFGSNERGAHGAGAALHAARNYGAEAGFSYGHTGRAWAIPTKDRNLVTLPLIRIRGYISGFLSFAVGHPQWNFKVTCIGCGLAGYNHEDIAPMFIAAPENCYFDERWRPWVDAPSGSNIYGAKSKPKNFWGTI